MMTAAILMVDDEPSMLELLGLWFAEAGYSNVRSAGNGQQALAMCCADSFDLVISDVNMPQMDGMTLLRKLRELDQHMPAIVFVSRLNEVSRGELLSLGASAFLQKPFRRLDLLSAVELALKGRQNGVEGEPLAVA
jgi:two-component system chemotaxis response regulator CheY